MMEVCLLIACYNGRKYIGECLRSLLQERDPEIQFHIVVADNGSTDGSADYIAADFPDVLLTRLAKNGGFTGGINSAWALARQRFPSATYAAIVNQDVIAGPGWARSLIDHLQANPDVAAAQPKVMLYPQKDRFNTAGNESHYLGFGLVTAYGQVDDGRFDRLREIAFASGAAAMIRISAVEGDLLDGDLLDGDFFLYLEDAELGWRLRQLGYRIDFVPASVVWHQYAYRHDYHFYFFLERNRWYLLGMYYKLPTLILLLPAIAAMEAGQFYFAWRNHVVRQKWRACAFFFSRRNLSRLARRRRDIQRRRTIGDREFTRIFVGEIDLPELRSTTLRRIGNPVLRWYWRLVRPLIFW